MKALFASIILGAVVFAGFADAASLNWTHSTGAVVDGYRVYVDDMTTPAAEVPPDVNTWELPAMTVGQEYLLGVSAYNQAGESAKNKIRVTWQEDLEITLPLQPVKISIKFE